MKVAVPLILALAARIAPRPSAGQEATPTGPAGPETVDAFAGAFVLAVRHWDVDAWAELVTEDVVMMAPNGRTIQGRDAFHALWSRSFENATGRNPLQVTVLEARTAPTLAAVRAEYGPEGQEPVGQYVWTLERDSDGAWRLAWWIFNRRPANG